MRHVDVFLRTSCAFVETLPKMGLLKPKLWKIGNDEKKKDKERKKEALNQVNDGECLWYYCILGMEGNIQMFGVGLSVVFRYHLCSQLIICRYFEEKKMRDLRLIGSYVLDRCLLLC